MPLLEPPPPDQMAKPVKLAQKFGIKIYRAG